MSSEIRTFSKLRGRENYDTWKMAAKSYLVIKGLWSWTQKEPDATKTSDVESDLKAWSELNLLLDESVYSYIANTTTAKEAWTNLEKSFEDSGLSRKVELLKQMVKLTLADCDSIEDYVSRMISTSLKVVKAGLKIEDEVLASLMLAGLPDDFKSLVMAIENSSKKLTTDAVKTLLLQETRLSTTNCESNAFFTKPKSKPFKYRCHKCGENGHMARDCSRKENDCPDKETISNSNSGSGFCAGF